MRFLPPTRQTESRDPLPPRCAPAVVRGGDECGAVATLVGGRRRLACNTPCEPPARRRRRCGRLHHHHGAVARITAAGAYSPPSRAPFTTARARNGPRLPQHQFGIELPSDTFDDGDGHDRRREVGFQADAVPPARREDVI